MFCLQLVNSWCDSQKLHAFLPAKQQQAGKRQNDSARADGRADVIWCSTEVVKVVLSYGEVVVVVVVEVLLLVVKFFFFFLVQPENTSAPNFPPLVRIHFARLRASGNITKP